MVRLEFLVDEDFLLTHTLFRDIVPPHCYTHSQTGLRRKGEQLIEEKDGNKISEENVGVNLRLFSEMLTESLSPQAQEIANRLKQTPDYRAIFEHTRRFKWELESFWQASYDRTLGIMQEITGLDFADDQFKVYSVSVPDGKYMGNGRIVFGPLKERFSNFQVVGLWREIMHGKMKAGSKDIPHCDDIEHSVIQLATDNELRVLLNGNGMYPPFEGHERYAPLMKKMLPHWYMYLASQERNILDFHRQMEIRRPELTQ